MQAVVLTAGQGTRIRPLSESVPKPMVPVAEKPLAAHTVDAAIDAGAEEIVLVVGYEQETVRRFFGTAYRGTPITYAEQRDQAGTADALRTAGEHLDGPFAVLNGDNLYEPAAIDRLFDACPAVCAVDVPDPRNYGVLSTADGVVTDIVEKPDEPPTNLANAGAYAFPEAATEWLDVSASERGEYEITDVLATVVDRVAVTPILLDRWLDVGRPWELLAANELTLGELDRRIDGDVSDGVHLSGAVVVESGATIGPGAVIKGPVLVRSGARVGPNATIRGATLLDRNVSVGTDVTVANSVLSAGTTLDTHSVVSDSVLGRDVSVGAGTIVDNGEHDDTEVRVTVTGDRVSTGRRTFGAVVGDEVTTGINSSLTPGVKLSSGVRTEPGEVVDGDR